MERQYGDLSIREAMPEDAEQLCRWWNDGAVMTHAGFPLGLGTTAEKVREDLAGDSDASGRRLIIEYRGHPIGEMNYRNMGSGTAEIGIKICDASFQEKGLGRVILSLFIRELFSMGYKKIILDTNLKNLRAQHVYEKLGFRRLRVNIDAWEDQLGEMQSSVDYELIPEDFHGYGMRSLNGRRFRPAPRKSIITILWLRRIIN